MERHFNHIFSLFCCTTNLSLNLKSKMVRVNQNQIFTSRYYAEACNEWRDPSPRLSA